MPNVFDPRNLQRLDNPDRRKLIPPHDTLVLVGLTEGSTFVDIGAGAGYFTLPAAQITGPSGRVVAADLSNEMLDHLKARAEEQGVNIETVLTPPDSLPLADQIADMTFMAFVFHELDDRSNYLAELKRITKPAGSLAIIDWAKVDSPMGPPVDHRVDIKEAIREIAAAGFRIESHGALNPYQYFVTARLS